MIKLRQSEGACGTGWDRGMRDAGRIAWTAESLLARGPLAALSVFRRQNPANIELVIEDAPPAQEPAAHTGLDMQNKKLIALAIASLALPAIAAEAPAAAPPWLRPHPLRTRSRRTRSTAW